MAKKDGKKMDLRDALLLWFGFACVGGGWSALLFAKDVGLVYSYFAAGVVIVFIYLASVFDKSRQRWLEKEREIEQQC